MSWNDLKRTITELIAFLVKYTTVKPICIIKDQNAMQFKLLSPEIQYWTEMGFPVQSFEDFSTKSSKALE